MVEHLGRLKVVTRRKEGRCQFKFCPQDNKIQPGQQAIMLTRQGMAGDRKVIFARLWHPKPCFQEWIGWTVDRIPPNKGGRRTMELDDETKSKRAKLVRERARYLRRLRITKSGDTLDRAVARIQQLDAEIAETGYPVIPYKGRQSQADIDFRHLVETTKSSYRHPRRVPVAVWEKARGLGMEPQFNEAMDNWQQELETSHSIEEGEED